MSTRIKLFLIAEFDPHITTPEHARAVLDTFRESTRPAQNYGIALYERATEPASDSAPCDECGAQIPIAEPSAVNAYHLDSCSLHLHRRDTDSDHYDASPGRTR